MIHYSSRCVEVLTPDTAKTTVEVLKCEAGSKYDCSQRFLPTHLLSVFHSSFSFFRFLRLTGTGRVGTRPRLATRPTVTTRKTLTDQSGGRWNRTTATESFDTGKDRKNDITLPTWLQLLFCFVLFFFVWFFCMLFVWFDHFKCFIFSFLTTQHWSLLCLYE